MSNKILSSEFLSSIQFLSTGLEQFPNLRQTIVNSTSYTIKKLKTNYNSALRNLLLIKKPYSASTMFVAHGIPSFYELLRTSIYRFADRVSKNSNSIIMACMTPIVYIHSPIRQWWRSVLC